MVSPKASLKAPLKFLLVSCASMAALVLLAFLSLAVVPAQGGNVPPEIVEEVQIAIDCKSLKGMGTVYLVVAGKGYIAEISCGISI